MKISYRLFIIILLLQVTSCSDILDLEPTDVLTEDKALETLDDYRQALIACYSGLTSGSYYGGTYIVAADRMSDDLKRSLENLGEGVQMHSYTFNAGTGEPAAIWGAAYSVLNRANIVINGIETLEINTATEEAQKNLIKGQALFIRALCHFDLVRYFAPRYDATADASHLGVPVMTESKISEPLRNTVAQVYQQVVSDLLLAKDLLSDQTVDPIKATDLAATALLARVYLYMRDWTNARDYASNVINRGSSLATGDNYRNIWNTVEANNEVVFKLLMLQNNAFIGQNYWSQSNDIVSFNPTEDLINLYDQADDVRFSSFIGIRPGDPDNVVTKYRGAAPNTPLNQKPANDGLAHIKILRISEMYLIRAEANYELLDQTAARNDLNALRVARINGFNPATDGTESGVALINAIRVERRKELAFEGHRWHDLKRWGLSIERGADCSASECELEADDYRFALPIPQGEILANENMIQNSGYDEN